MINFYVMDACALIALMNEEEGSKVVEKILADADKDLAKIRMHSVNVLEVYYDLYQRHGKIAADEELVKMRDLPILINGEIDDELIKEAGRLKITYKISLADSFALAEAIIWGGKLVTSDHHEFDIIETKENVEFEWIRPKPQTKK